MAKQLIIINVIITIYMLSSESIASPSYLPEEKCSLQDSVCITEQAGKLSQVIINGIPEIGVPKLDKMLIDSFKLNQKGLVFNIDNMEVEGLKNAVIDKVNIDMDLKILTLSFQTSLTITGHYNSDGKVFTLPIYGDGKATIKKNDVKVEMLILFDIVKDEDGNEVLELKNYASGFDVLGDVHYDFENAYDNDKEKSDKLHTFINRDWRTMVSTFGKYLVKAITDEIFGAIKIYLRANSLKELATY